MSCTRITALNCLVALLVITTNLQARQDESGAESKSAVIVSKFDTIVRISSIGQIQTLQQRRLALNCSDWLSLFQNQQYVQAIGFPDATAKEVREGIKKIQSEYRKLGEDGVFKECARLEKLINSKLNQRKRALCQNSLSAASFYRLSPVKFAEKIGCSSLEQKQVRQRLMDNSKELTEVLRQIENETLVELFSCLDDEKSELLSKIPTSISPKRRSVVSPIWRGLWQLENEPFEWKNEKSPAIDYQVVFAGYLSEFRPLPSSEFSDLVTLISAQDWQVNQEPSMKIFLQVQFEKLMDLEREHSDERSIAEEDYERVGLSKAERRRNRKQLDEQFLEKRRALAGEIEVELTPEEVEIFKRAKFLSQIQRKGPALAFLNRDLTRELGFEIDEADYELLAAKAKQIRPKLESRCHKIQEDLVMRLFEGMELDEELAWVKQEYPFGIPPLELLTDVRDSRSR